MRCTEDEAGKEVPIGEIFCFPIERLDGENCNTDCGCSEGYCAYVWINVDPIPIPSPVDCTGINGQWQLHPSSTCSDTSPEPGEPGECACPDDIPTGLPQPGGLNWDNKYYPVGCVGGEQALYIATNCAQIE